MKSSIFAVVFCALSTSSMAAPVVEFVTNKGSIELTLNSKAAPKTVANFMQYAKSNFYNGTVFHRVIDGFMIQGGGFTIKDGALNEKTTKAPIVNEADNGLKNTVGTIAMARTAIPDSASSQFFINVVDNDFLNFKSKTPQGWGYAVFGNVTKGLDLVQKISKTRTGSIGGMGDVPFEPIIIQKTIIRSEQ